MLYINLGVPYIKSICIKGKEYENLDYDPEMQIDLGVPYIKYINIKGKEYINSSYKNNSANQQDISTDEANNVNDKNKLY